MADPVERGARVRARASTRFVGRDAEVESLRTRLLAAATAGRGMGIVVQGDAGIGKTRLISEVCASLPDTIRLGHGRAELLQRDRPFGAIATAVRSLLGSGGREDGGRRVGDDTDGLVLDADAIVALERDTTGGVGPARLAQLVEAYVAAIASASSAGPVVLVLDDVQWADPATLAVVRELLDPVAGSAVVLAAMRPTPQSQEMAELLATLEPGQVDLVHLDPMPPDDVAALAHERLGAPPGPRLRAQLARTGGNPLFVRALLDTLSDEGSLVDLEHDGGHARIDTVVSGVPPSLRMTLLQRLSTLPAEALDTLLVAATLGSTFDPAELAVVLDEPASTIVTRLREPVRAGWIVPLDDGMAFQHDLVREALYDDAPAAVRRALHRQIAERLLAAGRPALEVARHLQLGATPPDPPAARWVHRAGREALASVPARAQELFDVAAQLDPRPGAWQDRLALDTGVARMWAGDPASAERILRVLMERRHDPDVDFEARMALAWSCILVGRSSDAIQLFEAGAAGSDDEETQVRFHAERALVHLLRGELDEARALAAEVLTPGSQGTRDGQGSEEARCLALGVNSALLAIEGRFERAIEDARAAVAIATDGEHPEAARRPPHMFLGSVLIDSDRFDEGWRALHLGRRTTERFGTIWDLPVQHLVSARGRFLAGQHDDVIAEVETALDIAERSDTTVLKVWGHAMLGHVHLHRGDRAAALTAITAGEEVVEQTGPQVRGTDWLLWARALLEEGDGNTEAARILLALVWEAHRDLGMYSERRLLGADLTRLCLDTGERDRAETVVADVEVHAEVAGTRSAQAAALRCRGLLDDDHGPLVEAAELLAETGCLTERVATLLDAGILSARTASHHEQAVELLTEARALAEVATMRVAVRRADAALRELGVRTGVRGDRGRPATGWASLTPTERTVTKLAAEGMTNPQIGERLFISRRTVQTHLSHVFAKLGVASRVELAGLVVRERDLDGGA